MKTDVVNTLGVYIKDFDSIDDALARVTNTISLLVRSGYHVILGKDEDVLYVEYASSGEAIPEFLTLDEFNALKSYREQVQSTMNGNSQEMPN